MDTSTASPTSLWCLYPLATESRGPLFVKHPTGIVLLGFSSQALANQFLHVWQLSTPHEAVLVSQLGTIPFPNHSGWMPKTDQVMLIGNLEQLRAYATDRDAFTLSSTLIKATIRYGPPNHRPPPND